MVTWSNFHTEGPQILAPPYKIQSPRQPGTQELWTPVVSNRTSTNFPTYLKICDTWQHNVVQECHSWCKPHLHRKNCLKHTKMISVWNTFCWKQQHSWAVSSIKLLNLYHTAHCLYCVHLKCPPYERCSHLNAQYTHVEAYNYSLHVFSTLYNVLWSESRSGHFTKLCTVARYE
jgi:hypothetical protein